MYNHEIKLINKTFEKDDIGNKVATEKQSSVLAKISDIGGFEFYNAKMAGLKPEIKFIIKSFEYFGEREVIYNNARYNVTRTYTVGFEEEAYRNKLKFDEIELTCERLSAYE